MPTPKTAVTNLFECPFNLRFARQCVERPATYLPADLCTLVIDMELVLKLGFANRQNVFVPGDPDIKCGQEKDAHNEIGD